MLHSKTGPTIFNILLPFRAVEEVRDMLAEVGEKADNSWIPVADMGNDTACNTNFPMK